MPRTKKTLEELAIEWGQAIADGTVDDAESVRSRIEAEAGTAIQIDGDVPEHPQRAGIEARRGIVRDKKGRILRSKEWKTNRIERLTAKIGEFETRIENANSEIKALQK